MGRKAKLKNRNNPIKLLRSALGSGNNRPMTARELSKVLRVPPDTLRAIECGRLRGGELSEVIKHRAFVALGALWNDRARSWQFTYREEPYQRRHYDSWQATGFNREEEIHALCVKLIALLQSTEDRFSRAAIDDIENFFEEVRSRFEVEIKDADYSNFRLAIGFSLKEGLTSKGCTLEDNRIDKKDPPVRYDRIRFPFKAGFGLRKPELFDFRYKLHDIERFKLPGLEQIEQQQGARKSRVTRKKLSEK
jgi:hypothetical protein